MSKKVVTIVGARPQFIKAAAVSRVLREQGINEIIVHTGQHFDKNMSEIFFDEMEIPYPDYNLGISSLGHGAMTGRMLEKIEEVLFDEKPDILMVFGDTNSTIAGALAAKKLGLKVAHIEAGLRSFNMAMPEEINRILTDRISDLLCCPTNTAVSNLNMEGFKNFDCRILNTGDVMYDAALFYSQKSSLRSQVIKNLVLSDKTYILATVHRQENTDNKLRLKEIIEGLNSLNKEIQVVVPLHPRTRKIISQQNLTINFTVIEPVGYFDMIELIRHSLLVITDSGGLQKEAFFFNKYCITMRDETEWIELVENGFNKLAGADKLKINSFAKEMLYKDTNFHLKLYGDGKASEKIVGEIMNL